MNKFAKVAAAVTAVAIAILPSQIAFAHAELGSSSPEANSVVEASPANVTLIFGEKLLVIEGADSANQVQVTNQGKVRVDNADNVISGEKLTVSLEPGLPGGTYKVAYRVVSEDGHPIEGSYQFKVKGPVAAATPATEVVIGEQSSDATSGVTSDKGAAIGGNVVIGAVVVGIATFFLFRRMKRK